MTDYAFNTCTQYLWTSQISAGVKTSHSHVLIHGSQIFVPIFASCLEFDLNNLGDFVPWQERSSVSSLKPFLQLHSKLPIVFRQKCSQPPLWCSHSSISVGKQATPWRHLSHKSTGTKRALFVTAQSDLCTFFRPAAAWSQRGSCSARPWMCPYRCSRTPHCSPRRFLKSQHAQWMNVNDLPPSGKYYAVPQRRTPDPE